LPLVFGHFIRLLAVVGQPAWPLSPIQQQRPLSPRERQQLLKVPRHLHQFLVTTLMFALPECGMVYGNSDLMVHHALERAIAANPGGRGGGLLMITAPGKAAEVYVAGHRSRKSGALLTPDTPFGLASVTKMLVTTLTLIYVERGLVDLNSPALSMVEDARPLLQHVGNRGFRKNLEAATLRDLLSHRSGLPDYWDSHLFYRAWRRQEDKQWRHDEILRQAGKLKPVCDVGRCFHYADTNFVILGLLLENMFGQALHLLLREEIFAPLEMTCTWMFFEEAAPPGCPPVAHSYEGRLDVTANRLQSADWAGGGLYSTLADQTRFLEALFLRSSLLNENSLDEMTRWHSSGRGDGESYGLGVYRLAAEDGTTLLGHMGVHNAFSYLWLERGILFTGSLNQEQNDARRRLLEPVMEILERRRGH
jgi:D-alanyl-D-alanine carboxypeptidase